MEILEVINQAFTYEIKPATGLNPNHCDECNECDTFVSSLNSYNVEIDDFWDNWRFDGVSYEFRKFLFPGICRLCLLEKKNEIEILFSYMSIRFINSLTDNQKMAVTALYQYIYDYGLLVDDEQLYRDLRDRLKSTRSLEK